MPEPGWLERRLVDAMHVDQLRQHGGSAGVRDDNAIDSALARPRNLASYRPDSDLAALAAAYGWGLARSHGYTDGNKRVAFMAMYVFLAINGREIDALEPEVVVVMLQVAAGGLGEEGLASRLRERVAPIGGLR